jgi:hypothetical protein
MKYSIFLLCVLISLFTLGQASTDTTVHAIKSSGIPKYVWLPALSGLIAQILNLLEAIQQDPARRPNFKDWVYWIPYVIAPLLGGFAGYFSFGDNEKTFTIALGVQVGIAAPLLLKGLASAAPKLNRPTT